MDGEVKELLEIEYKYNADDIMIVMVFKDLVKSLNRKSLISMLKAVISTLPNPRMNSYDYRMPSENKLSGEENRQELILRKRVKKRIIGRALRLI